MSKWWVKIGDSSSGPFTAKAIGKSVRAGRVRRDAQVRRDPGDPWVPLESVDVLVAALAPPRKRTGPHDDRGNDERRMPYSRPLFVAAILLTGLAAAARALMFALVLLVLFNDQPAVGRPTDTIGVAAFGLGLATLLYLWVLLGMTAHTTRSYKTAIVLHGLNVVMGLVSGINAKHFDAMSLVAMGFAVVAFIVTYRARDAFYES